MEHLLDESATASDLKKYESRYLEAAQDGKVSSNAQFEYAWYEILRIVFFLESI